MAMLVDIPNLLKAKALKLRNEDYMKKLAFGNNWNTINVSCTLLVQANANLASTELRLGVCEGTVAGYGSDLCADFVGCRIGNSVTWTYAAGPPSTFSMTTGCTTVRKQNTTITTSAATGTLYFGAYQTYRRSNLIVKIVKGSPNYTCSYYGPNSAANAQTDAVPATFLINAQAATPATTVAILNGASGQTVAYSGAANMDSINISWSGLAPLYIDRLAVVRLA